MASLTWIRCDFKGKPLVGPKCCWKTPGGEDVFAKMRKLIQELDLASGS